MLAVFGHSIIHVLPAQTVFEEWQRGHSAQNLYIEGKTAVDQQNNIYQAGASINADGEYEAVLSKIDRYGDLVWIHTRTGSGDGFWTDLALLPNGNVALTGVEVNGSQTSSTVLVALINAGSGIEEWSTTYAHPGSVFNGGASLSFDNDQNLYISGATHNLTSLSDVLVLKYQSNGALLWSQTKDFYGLNDAGVKVEYQNELVIVTGGAQLTSDTWRYGTLRLDFTTGAIVNEHLSAGSVTTLDVAKDLVMDDDGNIYVTGTAGTTAEGYNMYTMKLSDELELIWDHSYNFSGSNNDAASSICLDSQGNVIIAGHTDFGGGNTQFTAVKYSGAGAVLETMAYQISAGGDTAKVVTTDADDNIYISGSFYNGSNQDVKTVKYSPGGTLLWEMDYNGLSNGDDTVLDMVVNGEEIIVMVQTETSTGLEYKAIKYRESDYQSPQYGSSNGMGHAFSRNHGQLTNEDGDPVTNDLVPFYARFNGSFYRTDGIDYLSASFSADSTLNDTIQKVALDFYNSHSAARMAAIDKADYFENHYVPHAPQKLERIPHYGRLLYTNLWEGVDMETRFGQGQEFHFRVGDKGRVSNIAFRPQGADTVFINSNGDAVLRSFNRDVILPRPKVYQLNAIGILTELGWSPNYTFTGGILGMSGTGIYEPTKELWVRVSREDDIEETDGFCHSTYFGGSSDDQIWDSTTDQDGNAIACGTSGNLTFYIVTDYEYITPINNTVAAEIGYIVKFNRNFEPVFLSAFNGNARVGFQAIDVNDDGNIYCAGPTRANNLIGSTPSGINIIDASFHNPLPPDDNYPFATNSFITFLNGENGQALWASYFGGTAVNYTSNVPEDVIFDIAVDHLNRLIVTGTAADGSDFPLTPFTGHYYNDEPGAGAAFLARFSPDLDLEWCTYLGGSGADVATAVDVRSVEGEGRIAVSGVTSSQDFDFTINTNLSQQLSMNGSGDWFVCEFGNDGSMIWGTFEGSATNELVDLDGFEFPAQNIAYGSNGGLYFSYNTQGSSGLTFFNSSPGGFLLQPFPSNSSHPVLVEYQAGSYSPLWRTLLTQPEFRSKANSVIFKDNKLFLVGKTRDWQMPIVQASLDIYAASMNSTTGQVAEGFAMILEPNSRSLLHSTYFGGTGSGLPSTSINSVAVNNFNEMFAFGWSRAAYVNGGLGIPVKNNGIASAYFQPNKNGVLTNFDAFGFLICFEGSVLNISDEVDRVESLGACNVYPNPISGSGLQSINFDCSSLVKSYRIYSIDGKLLQGRSISADFSGTIPLDPSQLAPGFYLLELETASGAESTKLVISK